MDTDGWWKKLYPIRIPAGWSLIFHKLEMLEPDEIDKEDRAWLFHFVQDILYMEKKYCYRENKQQKEQVIGIDLGWYPDGDPEGAYRLFAVLDHNWEEPILEYTSRSTREIVDIIEFWLYQYFSSSLIDEHIFRKYHSNCRTRR